MARFLLSQYNTKTVNNPCDKKGDENRKKGDKTKSEDKDNNNNNNNTSIASGHVGETTMPQDSSTPSDGSSIGAHISDVTKHVVQPAQYVQYILAAYPISDPI